MGFKLMSHHIEEVLQCKMAVLMGANIAKEMPYLLHCATNIACNDEEIGKTFKDLFETENFQVELLKERDTVECLGILKV